MTVEETLKKYEGRNVKIGAKNGSGFIYCGVVRDGLYDWLKTKTEAQLERIDQLRGMWEYRLKDPEGYMLELGVYYPDDAQRHNIMGYAERQFRKYDKMLKNFKNINSSEVLEEYKSILPEERGTMIIIFDGVARGTFWTIEECGHMKSIGRQIERYEFRKALKEAGKE